VIRCPILRLIAKHSGSKILDENLRFPAHP
jgi:hypothetical protein